MLDRIGAVMVMACGPGPFSDRVSHAIRGVVHDGVVDYLEEAFTY